MKKIFCFLWLNLLLMGSPFAQSTTKVKQFNIENGLAIQGYDPVAYFAQNKAVKGQKQFAVVVEGITYYLSSEVNKNLFLKESKKYEPQYGGWCAYAMGASGEKVEVDPKTFKVKDGKLYLFYHSWTNNTLPKWNADENNLRLQADKHWSLFFH
jgi:YHS domain-containing protein